MGAEAYPPSFPGEVIVSVLGVISIDSTLTYIYDVPEPGNIGIVIGGLLGLMALRIGRKALTSR